MLVAWAPGLLHYFFFFNDVVHNTYQHMLCTVAIVTVSMEDQLKAPRTW